MCTDFGAADTTLNDLNRKSDLRRKLDCVLFTVIPDPDVDFVDRLSIGVQI